MPCKYFAKLFTWSEHTAFISFCVYLEQHVVCWTFVFTMHALFRFLAHENREHIFWNVSTPRQTTSDFPVHILYILDMSKALNGSSISWSNAYFSQICIFAIMSHHSASLDMASLVWAIHILLYNQFSIKIDQPTTNCNTWFMSAN
jgi:hypothetical protein